MRLHKRLYAPVVAVLLALSGCGLEVLEPPEPSATPNEILVTTAPGLPRGPAANLLFGLARWVEDEYAVFSEYRDNEELNRLIYQPLFNVDASFEPVPCLCVDIKSTDNMLFTLTLNTAARFSDGTSFSADDAAAAFDEAARHKDINVESVAILDESRLEVRLKSPNARFAALLDFPVSRDGLGTGPFMLDDSGGALKPNPYYDGKTPLGYIELVSIDSPDTLIYSFESGIINLVIHDADEANNLNYSGDYEIWPFETAKMVYLGFNTTVAPLDNPKLRLAMASVVDRAEIAEQSYKGRAKPAVLPVPPGSKLYDLALASEYDMSLARLTALFNELGCGDSDNDGVVEYPAGQMPLNLRLLVNAENPARRMTAASVATMLRDAGVSVTIVELSWENFLKALENGDFDLYIGETRLGADLSLSAFIRPDGALNYGGYENADCVERLDSWLAGASGDFYELFLREAPIVPLVFRTNYLLTKRGQISGIEELSESVLSCFAGWTISQ